MKRRIVVFGVGKISEVITTYFDTSPKYEVVAFTCDKEHMHDKSFLGRPVLDFASVEREFPPEHHDFFVAVGYQELNDLRKNKCADAKAKGYKLVSYIPEVGLPSNIEYGENCFIMDGAHIQPRVQIGHNVFVWSGALVAHHSVIQDNVWITSGAQIAGTVTIGKNTFVAIGATIAHQVKVGSYCFIGANVLVNKDLADEKVVIEKPTEEFRLQSRRFIKVFNFS